MPPTHRQPSLWRVLSRPGSLEEVNQRNVLIDAIGVGLAAGIGTFLSVFLVRLGASSFMVGLLTAMPALTGMILAMPIGQFLSRQPQIVPWFSKARLVVLSCYALTGLVPFFIGEHRSEAIIVIWAVATIPQTVVSVAFTVVMGGVAGPSGRFTLMSRRWSILGLTNSLTVLAAGQILNLFAFPLNYQAIFIASAMGGLISYVFSSSIKLPPVDTSGERQPFLQGLREHGATLRHNRAFVNFTTSQFLFRWGLSLPLPLFPIYWVRVLHASDGAIGAINSFQTAVTMVGYFLWARSTQRHTIRWVLLVCSLGISLYPLLTGLTSSVELLIVWAGLAGFFSAGIELVFFDILLSTVPAGHQAVYVGMYQTTLYAANFMAPLVGTLMADTVGIVPALAAGTVLRLAGFGLMAALKVGESTGPAEHEEHETVRPDTPAQKSPSSTAGS